MFYRVYIDMFLMYHKVWGEPEGVMCFTYYPLNPRGEPEKKHVQLPG